MELRTLKYFLAVAEEGNISNAAKLLHVSQPTLSRQLASLEQEFGRELYTRGRNGIELNEHGLILQHYANSIVSLSEKAEAEMSMPAKSVRGTVHIAAGECVGMALVTEAICRVRARYPEIYFIFTSGNTVALKEDLVRGFHDVMLECEVHSHAKMNVMKMPIVDKWGVLMRADDDLAAKDAITPEDLLGRPLVLSQQGQTRVMDSCSANISRNSMSPPPIIFPSTASSWCAAALVWRSRTKASSIATTATCASARSTRAWNPPRAWYGASRCPRNRRRFSWTP